MNIFYFCLLLLIMGNESKAQSSTDPATENIKRLFNETFNIIAAAKLPMASPSPTTTPSSTSTNSSALPVTSSMTLPSATTTLATSPPTISPTPTVTPSMSSPPKTTKLAAASPSTTATTLTTTTSLPSTTSLIPTSITTPTILPPTTTSTSTTTKVRTFDLVLPQSRPVSTQYSRFPDPPEPVVTSYSLFQPHQQNSIPSFTQIADDSSSDDSSSEIKDKNYDYEVCGNVKKSPDCTCKNNTLTCAPEMCYNWFCPRFENFKSANVKLMAENFVVKIAKFLSDEISVLKKGKVLPGNEGTVESLTFSSKITNIEDGVFDNFTSLRELDLSGNNLERISGKVFTKELGSTLVKLNFRGTQLKAISSIDLSNFSKLKILDFYSNPKLGLNELFVSYIFPESLSNLTYLNFARCGITVFNDDAFKNLLSLETLLLYGNPIITFPKSVYSMKNLRYLNLDETRITSVNYTEKNENSKLKKLHLKKTSLNFIDDCAFCNYPNLKDLQLYQNYNLTFIHENAFGFAYNGTSPPLESFSIEYCNLKTIPENLLDWNNVKAFGLGNNPFICNCSMAWLINDITSPTHTMNLQPIAPHPFMSYPTEITEMGIPHMPFNMFGIQSTPGFQLPYPSFAHPALQSNFLIDDGLKCFGPHALKHVKFIQISKNFCPNEAKREDKYKEYSNLVVAESSKSFTWIHIAIVAIALIFGFVIGFAVFPVCRYFYHRKKQEYGFPKFNFPDDKASEDFDEENK